MSIDTPTSRRRIAVDVGGTFIDFVMLDERTGELLLEKQPSTASRLVDEFLSGIGRLPVEIADVEQIFHGTTVAINAILQGRGVKVGLLTTRGFRDVLQAARGGRAEIYNLYFSPPSPLVERYLRREITERLGPDGNELTPLSLDEVDREVDYLVAQGAEAVAICFLHSYSNPAHERQAVERIRARHPSLPATASHEVAMEWREYERSSTTVLNASVQPLFGRYLQSLGGELRERGYDRPLALMQSNGGVMSGATAARRPIRTLESGPAGGVIGAHALARKLGHSNVICADVGGTSYDVALIQDGEILERTETAVARRPILGPIIDIESIGAGGGSIAWIDHRGALQVGPQSAGAHPGPACFGHGATEPTVTDCHLLLGRLDAEHFLGSRMQLDADAAMAALVEKVAEPLGMSWEDAAAGVLATAETSMTYAIRATTVERGFDPREFVMYSYGGGGGLFAAAVAEDSEISTVVVPRAPANFSAWGILSSDYREDVARTSVGPLAGAETAGVAASLRELADQARAGVAEYGFAPDDVEVLHRLDVRFVGQDATITVAVDGAWLEDTARLEPGVRERFVADYRRLYGHAVEDAPLEYVACRCRATGRVERPDWPPWERSGSGEPRTTRPVHFPSTGFVEAAIYERDVIAGDLPIEGPAIVEEWTATTVVPPDWTAGHDALGNLFLQRDPGVRQ